MKRTLILIFLLINTIISLIINASYCYVSGNTFIIPSDNKNNNPYHTYKIDKKTDNSQNKKNNASQKDRNQNINTNNNNTTANTTNNTTNTTDAAGNNTNNNTRTNNTNIKGKHIYNNNDFDKNKQKHNYSKHTNKNNISVNKTVRQNHNKTIKKPSRKRTITNSNAITKIEFRKHFIKIKEGSSKNILFTTNPAKASHTNIIYKSDNTSVAVYNNNKLTAVKKGFTTIIIALKNGTVKAACPVKVI
ncbi:MAG: hypothetical protein HFH68_02365 [Lachnospiraceae bacterium]|nr:hypothetical protein [Lachnospiraceae bacterium]